MGRGNSRDTILDAAERLIVREGVPELTIGRVAEEAQVSRGGIFYHFATKEAGFRERYRLRATSRPIERRNDCFAKAKGRRRRYWTTSPISRG